MLVGAGVSIVVIGENFKGRRQTRQTSTRRRQQRRRWSGLYHRRKRANKTSQKHNLTKNQSLHFHFQLFVSGKLPITIIFYHELNFVPTEDTWLKQYREQGTFFLHFFWNKNFDKRSELMLWNEMHKNETSETPSQLGNNSCHSRQETEAKKAETNSIWICSEWVYYQAFNHGLCRRVWGCSFYWRCKLKCS